jgi:opacity protein-like surface antigen
MRSLLATFLTIALSVSTFAQMDSGSNGSNGSYGDGASLAPDAFFLGAGPGVLDNLDATDWSVQFYGGRQWGLNKYIAPKAVFEATTDFGGALITSALIGANLYPVARTISPYLGAGAGVGYAKSSNSRDSDVFGFDVGSTFGLLMFRGSPLEVNLETNANFIFRDIGSDVGMPMSFSARVGLLF